MGLFLCPLPVLYQVLNPKPQGRLAPQKTFNSGECVDCLS